jgi:hypothetical protein
MDLPCKELPWLLLKPLHHHSLVVFVWPKYMALYHIFERTKLISIAWFQVWAVWGMVQCFLVHGAQHVLDSEGQMVLGVVVQHDIWTDFTPGILALLMPHCSCLHLFCCTALSVCCDVHVLLHISCQLLVCPVHSHVITQNFLYLLVPPQMGFIWTTFI